MKNLEDIQKMRYDRGCIVYNTNNYTEGISKTQRYKCIGNGWTVDVITHILKGLEEA